MEDEDDSSASVSVHLTHRVSICFFFGKLWLVYLPTSPLRYLPKNQGLIRGLLNVGFP